MLRSESTSNISSVVQLHEMKEESLSDPEDELTHRKYIAAIEERRGINLISDIRPYQLNNEILLKSPPISGHFNNLFSMSKANRDDDLIDCMYIHENVDIGTQLRCQFAHTRGNRQHPQLMIFGENYPVYE